ncbi:LOW QUALITY PROTEIN: ubiquitin-like-specific protease ESD4 [Rutidosis leptorrhynchoides]|uniref:LOW QUALITY PROTEIN: ubiquitin-like-specific protease ESD4 n=1 Tax=Rutidosis leptorrhynchoides TaxID=125765 RepID=UPI003A999DFF
MGAYALNRKRSDESFSPYPDIHISKKPKLLPPSIHHSPDKPILSTASRISRYPVTKPPPLRRQVHAPVRILKFGFSKTKAAVFSQTRSKEQEDKMGNTLSFKYTLAKTKAFGALRFFPKEKEPVVDVERNANIREEVILSDDDCVEEVEKRNVDDHNLAEEPIIQPSSSFVLTYGNFRVDDAGKLLDSFSLKPDLSVPTLQAYKNLLKNVERSDPKLKALEFEIQFNENKRSWFESQRHVKKPLEPEIPCEPFIPLSEEDEDDIESAFSNRNNSKILVTHQNSGIDITGKMLQCLRPGQWLNDEVINVYVELLKERESREPKKFLKCHFFNTFSTTRLVISLYGGFKAVKRWTTMRKLGYYLIDCDKIFVPIHRQIHWCLAIINAKDKKFQYLDSLKGRDPEVLKSLASYYAEEVKDKSGKVIDVSSWEREFVDDLPEQENGFDCGMFMVKYADFYSRGLGLCFEQEHMPYFRLRTAKEILKLRAD